MIVNQPVPYIADAAEYFLRLVHVKSNGCWHFRGRIDPGGFAYFDHKGRRHGARRYAFRLFNRELEPGERIHGHCPDEVCVNPEHSVASTMMSKTAAR